MNQKYIALISGGLDSTVAISKILNEGGEIELGLFFDYGQQAREREFNAATNIARQYGIHLKVITLDWLKDITKTSLVSGGDIPELAHDLLDDKEATDRSARAVWVPNRNGVFINVAASFAESMGSSYIITGFNKEEAATFPDNSIKFIELVSKTLSYSTLSHIKVVSPLAKLTKVQIIKLAYQLKTPLDMIWSCYRGGEKPCGKCESCLRLSRAIELAKK